MVARSVRRDMSYLGFDSLVAENATQLVCLKGQAGTIEMSGDGIR